MLARFFDRADRDVERFAAWLERLGPSGAVVLAIVVFGAFSAVDMLRFVFR